MNFLRQFESIERFEALLNLSFRITSLVAVPDNDADRKASVVGVFMADLHLSATWRCPSSSPNKSNRHFPFEVFE
jgi:hypothetical protein